MMFVIIKVDFGIFLLSMMTYCLFETIEILKFCFFLFGNQHKCVIFFFSFVALLLPFFSDKDKIGALHKDEFILFVEMLHSRDKSAPIANIITAVTMMDVDDDGKLTFEVFTCHHE